MSETAAGVTPSVSDLRRAVCLLETDGALDRDARAILWFYLAGCGFTTNAEAVRTLTCDYGAEGALVVERARRLND